MSENATARMNQRLAGLSSGASVEVGVDTMRHPYARLRSRIAWPPVTVTGILPEEQEAVVALVAEHLPSFAVDCHVLPETRPRRNTNEVQLVRLHRFGSVDFLYMLRISAEYMGGADSQEVYESARQGRSPGFYTDRIYFRARLFPVRRVELADSAIHDFDAYSIQDANFLVRDTRDPELRALFATALFDQIDFGPVEARFQDLFSFGAEWRAGRIFQPMVIEQLTLALNLLVPEVDLVSHAGAHFARAFGEMAEGREVSGLSDGEQAFWKAYYGAWDFRNEASRAGNPQWRLVSYPNAEWRARNP